MSKLTVRLFLLLTGVLVAALIIGSQSHAAGASIAINDGSHGTPEPYVALLRQWSRGYWFWRIAYLVFSMLAVTLPVVVAAGLPRHEGRRQILGAAAAAVIAIATFMHAGEKATAHEHAYMCMELADAAYRTGGALQTLQAQAERCSRFIDYDYLDTEATGKSRADPVPITSVP